MAQPLSELISVCQRCGLPMFDGDKHDDLVFDSVCPECCTVCG